LPVASALPKPAIRITGRLCICRSRTCCRDNRQDAFPRVSNFVTPARCTHASASRSFTDIVWRWASQMRAVLSQDAVTMRDPSGLKAAEDTLARCQVAKLCEQPAHPGAENLRAIASPRVAHEFPFRLLIMSNRLGIGRYYGESGSGGLLPARVSLSHWFHASVW